MNSLFSLKIHDKLIIFIIYKYILINYRYNEILDKGAIEIAKSIAKMTKLEELVIYLR